MKSPYRFQSCAKGTDLCTQPLSRHHSILRASRTLRSLDLNTSASEVNISDTSLDSYVSPSVVNAAHQVMMSDGAHINLSYVFLPETKQDPLHFHISIPLRGRKRIVKSSAMVDSGTTSLFISDKFMARNCMLKEPLERKIVLHNINGTLNKAETIKDKVSLYLCIRDQERKWDFLVTDLGPEDVILGLP